MTRQIRNSVTAHARRVGGWPLPTVLVAGLLAAQGCNWIGLAHGAATYREVRRGEAANVVAAGDRFYATRAEDGIAVIDAKTGVVRATIATPSVGASIDDLAVHGSLLFALDARPPGSISVYDIANLDHPRLVSGPHPVPVGPFSGVSAANGLCVVSGGTSSLTAWRFDSTGSLAGPLATADLGRGQPDVTLAADGGSALVSTHYWGPYFGVSRLRFDSKRSQLLESGTVPLDGAGFTAGGAKPANFPVVATFISGNEALVAHGRGVTRISTGPGHALTRGRTIAVGGPAVSASSLNGTAAVAVGGDAPLVLLLAFEADSVRVLRRISLPPGTIPGGIALGASSVAIAARSQGVLVFMR